MKLVIDSSTIFTVIVSGEKSKAFEIVDNSNLELYYPEDGLLEFKKHKNKLEKLSTDFEFRMLLTFSLIHILPAEFYESEVSSAYGIAGEFDEKDTPFIALAMKLNIPIWTSDKDIIKFGLTSEKYLALDTQALEMLLQGKSLEEIKEKLREKYLTE